MSKKKINVDCKILKIDNLPKFDFTKMRITYAGGNSRQNIGEIYYNKIPEKDMSYIGNRFIINPKLFCNESGEKISKFLRFKIYLTDTNKHKSIVGGCKLELKDYVTGFYNLPIKWYKQITCEKCGHSMKVKGYSNVYSFLNVEIYIKDIIKNITLEEIKKTVFKKEKENPMLKLDRIISDLNIENLPSREIIENVTLEEIKKYIFKIKTQNPTLSFEQIINNLSMLINISELQEDFNIQDLKFENSDFVDFADLSSHQIIENIDIPQETNDGKLIEDLIIQKELENNL